MKLHSRPSLDGRGAIRAKTLTAFLLLVLSTLARILAEAFFPILEAFIGNRYPDDAPRIVMQRPFVSVKLPASRIKLVTATAK
jgi:hypothetical protein